MNDKPITSQQLAFLIFLLIPGSALVYVPGELARQDAWLAAILAMIPGLFILYAMLQIHKLYPDLRITQVSTKVLGKIPGTILNLLFLASVAVVGISLLYDMSLFLGVTYPSLTRALLPTLVILTCAFCLYQGLNIMAHLGEIFIWVTLLFLAAGFILSLPLVNLSMLSPVLESWKPILSGTLYAADWPFGEVVLIALFLPLVSDLQQSGKELFKWYLLGGLSLVLVNLEAIAILGPDLINIMQFPLFEVYRLAGFGEFRRLEIAFLFLWFITGITAILIYYQSLNFALQDLFSLKDYRPLILPAGLCMIVFTLFMLPNNLQSEILEFQYVPIYSLSVNLLYPTIIMIAAKIRRT